MRSLKQFFHPRFLVLALVFTPGLLADAIVAGVGEYSAIARVSVTVDGMRRGGTGFVVAVEDRQAFLLTAAHVIAGGSDIEVELATELARAYVPAAEYLDLNADLAVLTVLDPPPEVISLAVSDLPVPIGESVAFIGFPRRAVAPRFAMATLSGREGSRLVLTGPVVEGSSGSPILRLDEAVGLITEVESPYFWAAPGATLRLALEGWRIPLPAPRETGLFVDLWVTDPADHPLEGVQIEVVSAEHEAASAWTKASGMARLELGPEWRPGEWVKLQLDDRELVFLSPWDARVRVPPPRRQGDIQRVVLAHRGDKALLQDPEAVVRRILEARSASALTEAPDQEEKQRLLAEQSAALGFTPDEVEQAIDSWSEENPDAFERGLAALYREDFASASELFAEPYRERGERFVAAARYLGEAARGSGQVPESVEKLREAAAFRPRDAGLLTSLGASLFLSQDYREAGQVLARAGELHRRELPAEDPAVLRTLHGQMLSLEAQGELASARQLHQKMVEELGQVLARDGSRAERAPELARTSPPDPATWSRTARSAFTMRTALEDGLLVVRLYHADGRLRLTAPGDLVAGERISGTLDASAAGGGKPPKKLSETQLVVNGRSVSSGAGGWTVELPSSGEARFELRDRRGKTVAELIAPLRSPNGGSVPSSFSVPAVADGDRTLTLTGPFDGDQASTRVAVGGREARVLAESSRGLIVAWPEGEPGSSALELTERGRHLEGRLHRLTLRLQADKGALRTGERDTLALILEGLHDLGSELSVELTQLSPEVAVLDGGPRQVVTVPRSAVDAEGRFVWRGQVTATGGGVGRFRAELRPRLLRLAELTVRDEDFRHAFDLAVAIDSSPLADALTSELSVTVRNLGSRTIEGPTELTFWLLTNAKAAAACMTEISCFPVRSGPWSCTPVPPLEIRCRYEAPIPAGGNVLLDGFIGPLQDGYEEEILVRMKAAQDQNPANNRATAELP